MMPVRRLQVMVLAMLLVVPGVGLACNSGGSISDSDKAILEYADPATETVLQALQDKDLAKYVQYGNAVFKAAVTQQVLDAAADQVSGQFGQYQSKTFLRTEMQQGYTIVHYRAAYSRGSIGVRMVFDSEHMVAGQFFE